MSAKRSFVKGIILYSLFYWAATLYAATPWLHTDANQLKDPAGNVVVLRGVDMMDLGLTEVSYGGAINMIDRLTDKSDSQGSSPGWYPKVIRIMIAPPDSADWPYPFDANNTILYDLLRTTVDYCKSKDLYVIIDWHYIANTYDHRTSTRDFWRYMAPRFANDSHVMFELFNEPINNIFGSEAANWASVKMDMQNWINLVRTYALNNIILVAGSSWAYEAAPIAANPLDGDNILVVHHIYPQSWITSPSGHASEIDNCLKVYPVIITEWGFTTDYDPFLNGTITNFGQPLMDFREARNVSNSAWVASYDWGPPMFYYGWDLRVGEGEMGGFVKDKLYEKRNANQPVEGDTVPPAAPANLTATLQPEMSRISLNWTYTPGPDFLSYVVYRSKTQGSGYARISTRRWKRMQIYDLAAAANTTYYYVIAALDTSYNQSSFSNEVSATLPPDSTRPTIPMSLVLTPGSWKISMDWIDCPDIDIAGYNIYRSITPGSEQGSDYIKVNSELVLSSDYIDNTVINGTTYYYVVTSVDTSSNESLYSNERSTTPFSTYQDCAAVWVAGYGLPADLDRNCYVEYEDVGILAGHWLNQDCAQQQNCQGADFVPANGSVNFYDFSVLTLQWMQCNNPQDPDCTPNW